VVSNTRAGKKTAPTEPDAAVVAAQADARLSAALADLSPQIFHKNVLIHPAMTALELWDVLAKECYNSSAVCQKYRSYYSPTRVVPINLCREKVAFVPNNMDQYTKYSGRIEYWQSTLRHRRLILPAECFIDALLEELFPSSNSSMDSSSLKAGKDGNLESSKLKDIKSKEVKDEKPAAKVSKTKEKDTTPKVLDKKSRDGRNDARAQSAEQSPNSSKEVIAVPDLRGELERYFTQAINRFSPWKQNAYYLVPGTMNFT
jgi:hypothetical protein